MKRLAICFDGTWNDKDQQENGKRAPTNVWRLHDRIAQTPEQSSWYDAGVGTRWQDRLRGGLTGYGISRNILQGYMRLIADWREGNQIYLFGFSRGAYTARSLAGLLRACWLPRAADEKLVDEAYKLYRDRKGPDSDAHKRFRETHCRPVEVHFLGVWDTVGSLGVPGGLFKSLNERLWGFHDTELSRIVRNAFQAIAVDEHRPQYEASLWADRSKPGQTIEQRWFIGAHANVGGGYGDSHLSAITLEWIVEHARSCGLVIAERKNPLPENFYAAEIRDSYREFLGRIYRMMYKPFYRPIPIDTYTNTVMTIDPSVHKRMEKRELQYAPKNVVEALARLKT